MTIYDCIIIGSGPAGLTFATLADKNEKIMIIEKDKFIGGCHKVNRQRYENENYFCEHGPRVYFNNYINFKMILNKIGLKFKNVFVKQHASLSNLIYELSVKYKVLNFREIWIITVEFFKVLLDPNYGKKISLNDFMKLNNFTENAFKYTDRFVRLSDGGDITKISLNSYLQLINEAIIYTPCQPRLPNDEGLFNVWKNYLNYVDFKFNTAINRIEKDENGIIKLTSDDNETFLTRRLILAIPPTNLYKILQNSSEELRTINDLAEYSEKTEYNDYISITFHWNFEIKELKDINESLINDTDWGIIKIILSNYMKFKERNSKTVISCNASYLDRKSKFLNKTANECKDKNEVIYEIYRQLKEIYPTLPIPTLAFINNYYDGNKWKSGETAFIKTVNYNHLKNDKLSDNIYILGTHNGNAKVHFTSFESAVSNAIALINKIYDKDYPIKKAFTIKDLIMLIIVFIIIVIILFIINY
jgi:protoporphyrinogen oxidase